MAFFNKKEEVLQIKLTQYGKHLLSKGKFEPQYYAFYDDSVIYDAQWAGHEEIQNEAEGRIQEETPSLKVQHIFAGVETNMKKMTTSANPLEYWEKDLPYPQHTEDRHYSLGAGPLGNSSPGKQEAPAYLVNFLIGEITGSSYYLTGSHQILKIPQLDVDVVYETSFSFEDDEATVDLRGPGGVELGGTFADGSKVNVAEKHILIEVIEENTEFSNKNFDIEVFLMEEEDVKNFKTPGISHPTKREQLLPKYFVLQNSEIVNNILVDPVEEDTELNINLDSNYIQHYFDIFVDEEIDTTVMCSAITSDKADEMYDEIGFECPDASTASTSTDSESGAYNNNDQEVCD
jgi:hypothetical protein